MSRLMWLGVLCLGGLANASAPAHGEKQDVASFIFHHVSDSSEYTLEVPPPLSRYFADPVVHLPVIRYDLTPGACPADLHEHASLAQHGGMRLQNVAKALVVARVQNHGERAGGCGGHRNSWSTRSRVGG